MEMAGALFMSMLGSGAAAGAATVAVPGIAGAATLVPAAGGLAAGGMAAGGLSLLQGLGTVFSTVATIGSGFAARSAGRAEAEQQKFAERDEFIAGKETSASLKAEMARTVSNQAVAFAAGGVNLGSVSVQQAKQQAIEDAEKELSIASSETLSRAMARRRAASNARSRGNAALTSSIFQAGMGVIDYGLDLKQRG